MSSAPTQSSRLRVGQQLYGAFAAVLLLTALVGGGGRPGLARLDSEAEALADKWLRGVGQLADARSGAASRRASSKSSTAAPATAATTANTKRRWPMPAKAGGEAMAVYERAWTIDAERHCSATFAKAWDGLPAGEQTAWSRSAATRSSRTPPTSATALASMAIRRDHSARWTRLTKFNFERWRCSRGAAARRVCPGRAHDARPAGGRAAARARTGAASSRGTCWAHWAVSRLQRWQTGTRGGRKVT